MRAHELLIEKDVIALKNKITDMLKDSEDIPLLQRIFKVLNTDDTRTKITRALGIALGDETQFKPEPVIAEIVKLIGNEPGEMADVERFIKRLEKGNVININELTKSGLNTFDNIFYNDKFSISIFKELKNYGAGSKLKGPGEFALAILSPKIAIQSQRGDINIDGSAVEVKAAAGTSGGAGRLGDGSNKPSGNWIKEFLESHGLASSLEHLSKRSGMSVKHFTTYTSRDIEDERRREEIGKEFFSSIFDANAGAAIAKVFKTGNSEKTMTEYAKQNFKYYQNLESWKGLLGIYFNGEKTLYVETENEFIALQQKGLGLFSAAAYPSGGNKPNEHVVQLKM